MIIAYSNRLKIVTNLSPNIILQFPCFVSYIMTYFQEYFKHQNYIFIHRFWQKCKDSFQLSFKCGLVTMFFFKIRIVSKVTSAFEVIARSVNDHRRHEWFSMNCISNINSDERIYIYTNSRGSMAGAQLMHMGRTNFREYNFSAFLPFSR